MKILTNPAYFPQKIYEPKNVEHGITIGRQLFAFMKKFPGIKVLSAPQVGVGFRVAVARFPSSLYLMVNPSIVSHSKHTIDFEETCFMFPNKRFNTKRYINLCVQCWNWNKEFSFGPTNPTDWSQGLLNQSMLIQRSIDYLDGELLTDPQ